MTTAPGPPETQPGPETTAVLQSLTPDPFVQAALWRVWAFGASGLLDQETSRRITEAYVADYNAQREGRR